MKLSFLAQSEWGLKPLMNLFCTVEFVYSGFVCNVNSPIMLHLCGPDGIFYMHFDSLETSIRQ